jgi:YD repeat-containing protein
VKVSYDARADVVTVVLRDGVPVAESDEGKPGVILDYDDRGNLVAVEILDASTRVTDARRVEFQMTE